MQKPRGYRPPQYEQNGAYTQRQYRDEYEKPNAFLSALLYIVTIVSICAFIGLSVLRSLGVGHVIRNTDILSILEDAAVGEHTYYIVDQVNGLHFNNNEVTLEDINDFIQSEAVSDEIGSIIDDYANAFILGNPDHHITTDDIVSIARNLEPELYEFFDHRMTDEDFEHLASTMDDILDFDSLNVSGLMEDLDVDLSVPLILISPMLIWSVGILCVLLLAAIFILRRGNPADAALAVGIPIAFSGLIIFVAGVYIGAYPEALGETAQRFARYLEDPAHLLSQQGFTYAAVGVTIIIISFMAGKVAQRGR